MIHFHSGQPADHRSDRAGVSLTPSNRMDIFFLEVVAGYCFCRCGSSLNHRSRLSLLFTYSVSAWFSLFWVNGILAWQLTPGEWLQSGDVFDGFFNSGFLSSLNLSHNYLSDHRRADDVNRGESGTRLDTFGSKISDQAHRSAAAAHGCHTGPGILVSEHDAVGQSGLAHGWRRRDDDVPRCHCGCVDAHR